MVDQSSLLKGHKISYSSKVYNTACSRKPNGLFGHHAQAFFFLS